MPQVVQFRKNEPGSQFGYKPPELNEYQKQIEATWGKDPNAIRTVISTWILQVSRRKDNTLDVLLFDELRRRTKRLLESDVDCKLTGHNMAVEIGKIFERSLAQAAAL